jgi:hypothetical protein
MKLQQATGERTGNWEGGDVQEKNDYLGKFYVPQL